MMTISTFLSNLAIYSNKILFFGNVRFWKTSFSHYNRQNSVKLHYFCKLTQSVHPPKPWALDFWKIKFVHIPFFSRAEDFLSQGNTSLRISTKLHFSIWLNKIYLNEFHIIKRNVKITPNAKSHVYFFQNDNIIEFNDNTLDLLENFDNDEDTWFENYYPEKMTPFAELNTVLTWKMINQNDWMNLRTSILTKYSI